MDLLSPDNELDLSDLTWKIYTEDVTALPQYIGTEARIQNAYITQGCVVEGEVTNSVVFTGATDKAARKALTIPTKLLRAKGAGPKIIVTK